MYTKKMENKLRLLVNPDILKIKPYEPGKPIEEVKRELGLREVIKLASNENPLGPSPKAVQAIKDCALKVNFYPDGGGYYLKKALSERLFVKDENIILGNGSDEIISMISRLFLAQGEEAIIPAPSFLMFKIDVKISGGKLVSIPLKNFRIDLKKIRKAVTPRTKLIFIANPNNPTGTIVKKDEIKEFLENIPESPLTIIDEAYYEYVEDKKYPEILDFVKKGKNIIILRTFSKIYGLAGLRIGYGIAKKEIIDILNRIRSPFNVNSLAQAAALASLNDEDQVKRSRELVRKGKEFLYFHLRKMGVPFIPTEANFILIKVGENAKEIENNLLHRGIIVRGMTAYNLSQYIRVSIGTAKQNEEFIRELRASLR